MLLVRINISGHYFSSVLFGPSACGPERRKAAKTVQHGHKSNQLSNDRPVYTGNHCPQFAVPLHWWDSYFLKRRNGDGFLCSPCRTPGSGRRLQSNLLATFPKEKLSVDFGTRCQTLPTNPAFFLPPFSNMLAQDLARKWGKRSKRRREEREEKNSPRAGGRYCMHVHWSTRFVASCLRIFFLGSQDYPQSQGRERQSTVWLCQCKAILPGNSDRHCQPSFFTSFSLRHSYKKDLLAHFFVRSNLNQNSFILASLIHHFSLRTSNGSVWSLFFTYPFVIAKWGECWSSPPPAVWNGAGWELLPRSRSSICTAMLVKRLKGPEPLKHLLACSSILYVVKLLKAKQT